MAVAKRRSEKKNAPSVATGHERDCRSEARARIEHEFHLAAAQVERDFERMGSYGFLEDAQIRKYIQDLIVATNVFRRDLENANANKGLLLCWERFILR